MKSRTIIRTFIYLLIYLGFPAFGMWLDHETVTPVFAIIYILVLIPVGILKLIDFYHTNDGTTVLSRVFNAMFRVPLGMFGLACIVAGVAILAGAL
jgi:hypothetical protein